MNIIFQIDGGIGKSVAATAVCRAIKSQFPNSNLIVITSYPIVFLCNPNVSKILSHDNLLYFYKDYIQDKEIKTFLFNPYMETDFIAGNTHLIQVWCEMFGIKYNGELPELFLTHREYTFHSNQLRSDKPIMALQTNGGGGDQANKYSRTRDLPVTTAQKIIYELQKDYHIVHIRRDDHWRQSSERRLVPTS